MREYQHKVQYYETDRMGIVHHSNYIRWMEEARIDFLEQIGWNYERMEAEGIISPVTAIECKYKVNTTFADVIKILVFVEEFKGVRLKLNYIMKKDDIVVFEGKSEHCFLDSQGKLIRLKKEYPELNDLLKKLSEEYNEGVNC